MGVVVKRLILVLSFACVAGLALLSVNEWLIAGLLGVFVLTVYKDPLAVRSVNQKQLIHALLLLMPASFIFFVKAVHYSNTFTAPQAGFIMSLGLLFGGVYFVCVVLDHQDKSGPSKISIDQTRVPVPVMVYYGLFAVVTMLFATQSSPLYPINYWDDTNIYRTVAECIFNGKVLYVDIHEQKGLFTFIMELPGVLISRDTFFGMYVIEAVVFFLYSLFSLKIVSLFIKPNKIVWALVPVFSLITFTSNYFRYGGCVEELLLPFLTYAFYLGLKVIKTDAMFTYKDAFVIGLITSCVFWSKYIDCGLFFGLVLFVIVYAVRKKQANKILPLAGSFLGGFLVICAIVATYFLVNHAFDTMIEAYFLGNLSYVGIRRESLENSRPVTDWIMRQITLFNYNLSYERLFFVFGYSAFAYLLVKKERRCLLYSVMTFGVAALFIYGSGICIEYYLIGLKFFCALGWIPFIAITSKAVETIKSNKLSTAVIAYSVLMLSATLIVMCPSVFKLGSRRNEIPQYRFADKINSVEDPKVLNFGFLDTGFFLGSDILPFNNHYCTYSIYDVYGYEQIDLLNQQAADFIVTDYEYEFYDYVLCDQGSYENVNFRGEVIQETFYLYERRN